MCSREHKHFNKPSSFHTEHIRIAMENGKHVICEKPLDTTVNRCLEAENIGTKGTLRIGSVGSDSLLEVLSENGVCRECYPDFMYRWHDAYIEEMNEFIKCVRENRKPGVTVYDETMASETAHRCKQSFETGKMLPFRDAGIDR